MEQDALNGVKDTGTGGGTAPDAGEQKAEIVYGKQPVEAAEGTTESGQPEAGAERTAAETERDKKAEFRALIEGEYKEESDRYIQGIFNRRFKDYKGLQEQNDGLNRLAQKLGDRYGVDPRDLKSLESAIDGDQSFLRDQADKAGMTVEQYRQMQELKRQNDYWRLQREAQQQAVQQQQMLEKLNAEEKAVQQIYPDFNLDAELQNPDFFNLIKSGIPMDKAYQVVHYDQIVGGALQYAVNEAKAQTANTIRARAMRPLEGAANGAAPVTVKSDVSKLTKEDREEIARQVMRGKTITFS